MPLNCSKTPINPQLSKQTSTKRKTKKIKGRTTSTSTQNLEPWHFISVRDQEKRQALAKGVYAEFATQAPDYRR